MLARSNVPLIAVPRVCACSWTQAQRDFFGAHTYMRLDGSGPVHTEWVKGV